MKYRTLIALCPLFLLLIGALLSFSTTNWGVFYTSKSACEAHEGAGNCSECDGGWHTTSGCCLIVDIKKGDSKAIKKYHAILKKEYQNLKTESDKAKIKYEEIKKTKVSSKSIEVARKYAEETDILASKSKAELTKFQSENKLKD